jgi:hypothetical protein
MRNVYVISVRKPEGKKPLGKHKRRLQGSVKVVLEGTEYKDVD